MFVVDRAAETVEAHIQIEYTGDPDAFAWIISDAEDAFYGCLRCHESDTDANAWSAEAFAQAMEERIVAPGEHAGELLEKWPYLTRMFTIISRHEMTVDPESRENASFSSDDGKAGCARPRLAVRRRAADGGVRGRVARASAPAGMTVLSRGATL